MGYLSVRLPDAEGCYEREEKNRKRGSLATLQSPNIRRRFRLLGRMDGLPKDRAKLPEWIGKQSAYHLAGSPGPYGYGPSEFNGFRKKNFRYHGGRAVCDCLIPWQADRKRAVHRPWQPLFFVRNL